MRILFATSECVPFAKTGGLADVCGSLPKHIARLGHHVFVFMPNYQSVKNSGMPLTSTGIEFEIPIGTNLVPGQLLQTRIPQSSVPVYLVDQPKYFERAGLYQNPDGTDYEDNCERFVFFCRALFESIRALDLKVDLIHCNDWQTGLIPAILSTEYASVPRFESTSTLMTIHNLAYQGLFWHWDMLLTGMDWKHFNWKEMEFYGQLNLLKTGIVFADAVSTVSPNYALEIQTGENGCGLENTLQHRRANLSGILNGIDESWNPATDTRIKANYDLSNWKIQKPKCKWALQKQLAIDESNVPLIGLVGRMAEQKGWSLILEILRHWLEAIDVQWAILGTGHQHFEKELQNLAARFPHKLGLHLGFDESLARQIEAGADLFLMPSQYEPCGLNQMYSMRYGTVPVVHKVGGLADTVCNVSERSIADGTANGFVFEGYSAENLESALARAIQVYLREPGTWEQIVETGMSQDFSWRKSASDYANLYERIVATRKVEKQQFA